MTAAESKPQRIHTMVDLKRYLEFWGQTPNSAKIRVAFLL